MRPIVLGLLLLAYVIPALVGAAMFSWLFDSNFGGTVNHFIAHVDRSGPPLVHRHRGPTGVVLTLNIVWFLLPFAMLIILAGLQGVNPRGIGSRQDRRRRPLPAHRNVIIPSVRGVIGFVILISLMDVLRVFDPLVALSPQAAAIGNESIMFYIYSVAFKDGGQQLGLGSAINVLLIILIGIMLIPSIRATAREGSR